MNRFADIIDIIATCRKEGMSLFHFRLIRLERPQAAIGCLLAQCRYHAPFSRYSARNEVVVVFIISGGTGEIKR